MRLFTSCEACRTGNAKRAPAPRSTTNRATSLAYCIHADTTGRVRPSTPSSASYLHVAVDDVDHAD